MENSDGTEEGDVNPKENKWCLWDLDVSPMEKGKTGTYWHILPEGICKNNSSYTNMYAIYIYTVYIIYTIYRLHCFTNKSLHHHQHICHTLTPHPVFFHIQAPFPAPSSNTALPCSIARARDVAKCAMRTTAGGHVESPVGSWETDESLEWLLICWDIAEEVWN